MINNLKKFFINILKLLDEWFNVCENAIVIVAMDYKTHGIGFEGHIPWNVKEDMAFFKKITTKNNIECRNIIVCGKNTFDSFSKGGVNATLNNRHTIVISKSLFEDKDGKPVALENFKKKVFPFEVLYSSNNEKIKMVFCMNTINGTFVVFVSTPNDVLYAKRHIIKQTEEYHGKLFIIGGGKIYNEFINGVKYIRINEAYITCLRYNKKFNVSTPSINEHCSTCNEKICDNSKINYRFHRFDTFFNFNKIKATMKFVSFIELDTNKISKNVKLINTKSEHIVMKFKRPGFFARLFDF